MKLDQRTALLCTADLDLTKKFMLEIARSGREWCLAVAADLDRLRAQIRRIGPRVILLDESALNGTRVEEALSSFTAAGQVILLVSLEGQTQMTQFVAEGEVDCVIRAGDFVPLAVALIERHVRRSGEQNYSPLSHRPEQPPDLAEVLRHEINNPLTGILGNAELALAHRDRLPPAATQRLETVVDLAVRLRETVRRLSTSWEGQNSVAPLV